jgi:hypothetical protein
VQGPKHVVRINKDNNIRWLSFDPKELLHNCQVFVSAITSVVGAKEYVNVEKFAKQMGE